MYDWKLVVDTVQFIEVNMFYVGVLIAKFRLSISIRYASGIYSQIYHSTLVSKLIKASFSTSPQAKSYATHINVLVLKMYMYLYSIF